MRIGLVGIVEDRWVSQLEAAIASYDRVRRHALDANAAAVLVADPVTGAVGGVGFAVADAAADATSGGDAAAPSTSPSPAGDSTAPGSSTGNNGN